MDNLDDSETNAKISDSAYSNSCSNSQSRRSHSSKSTHSGSNSSGSSGYGGKPSNSGSNNALSQPQKKDKDTKKKKSQTETKVAEAAPAVEADGPKEPEPIFAAPLEQPNNVVEPTPALALPEIAADKIDISKELGSTKEEASTALQAISTAANYESSPTSDGPDGFSCVISMHDGVVLHSTQSITKTLGFPKDMWIGRSFIDFVHPRDRDTFASHMSSDLVSNDAKGTQDKKVPNLATGSTIICRLRRYRGLNSSFVVKDRAIAFMPFLLKITYKNMNAGQEGKIVYLVIQATPFVSAYKVPNEVVQKPIPFVIRHASDGNLEYIDPESVPYLGYLPQDMKDKNIVQLFHPEDLLYLKHIYESIVKEGSVSRSKTYRMMARNGGYVKLETEWSSFTNPWSKKLEFVIGKHHIIEGPNHPDVLKSPDTAKKTRIHFEVRNRIQGLRESIVKVMSEVLTKPAETAKQQLTERCQDLTSFMDSLIEDPPMTDDDVAMDLQESDNAYYERGDSVMLGGISPHHEYDSKSSTETPLSYNQLNYNENLQRYFDSHQPNGYEDYKMAVDETVAGLKNMNPVSTKCMSPSAQNSGDSNMSSCESSTIDLNEHTPGSSPLPYQHVPLTETVLNKHNAEMESELVKMHRETRSSSKGDRERASNESRQKKKEHLARCNASFHPTMAGGPISKPQKPPLKRPSKQENESSAAKQHCSSPRQPQRRAPSAAAPAPDTATIASALAPTQWPVNHVGNMNHYVLGMPQQMSLMPPPMPAMPDMAGLAAMPGMHGMYPMYYAPAMGPGGGPAMVHAMGPSMGSAMGHSIGTTMVPTMGSTMGSTMSLTMCPPEDHSVGPPVDHSVDQAQGPRPSTSSQYTHEYPSTTNTHQYQQPQYYNPMPCMMYGHPMYGQSFVYPMQMQHPMTSLIHQNVPFSNANPFDLTEKNFEEACKLGPPPTPREKKRPESAMAVRPLLAPLKEESGAHSSVTAIRKPAKFPTEHVQTSSNSLSSKVHLFRSSEPVPVVANLRYGNSNTRSSDDTVDKTDGESSYSSFYSSFLKTDSGSAEESSDFNKKLEPTAGVKNRFWTKTRSRDELKPFHSWTEEGRPYYEPPPVTNVGLKKSDPPWMEQVSVTPELLYKYQIVTRPLEEVLAEDKEKLSTMEQSPLITDQLQQLYMDLRLEGVAARLNLDEAITSSSSSEDESIDTTTKDSRKRQYSRLVMIYEEDAPLPPPLTEPETDTNTPSCSNT